MKTWWDTGNRSIADRLKAEFEQKAQWLRLHRRIDAVLIVIVCMGMLILSGFWTGFVNLGDRLGWFDAPLTQPVKDERILTNVRDLLPDKPMLDAVYHQPDGLIYLSQTSGMIHRYDPLTHLWSSDSIDSSDRGLIDPNFIQLRSGCGAGPMADHTADCPDPDSLWAVSAQGGLARRNNGKWKIVASDTAFIGARGTPVEHSELTTAAISEGNQWLVVGTRNDGLGIYNIAQRRWIQNDRNFYRSLPSSHITHLRWWRDRFWIGSPEGLLSLKLDHKNARLVLPPRINGRILDLDASPEGGLWILAQGDCVENGTGCLLLARITEPDTEPVALIDEQNNYPDLNLADLNFAMYRDNQLFLAGDAGLYLYNAQLHSWQRLFDRSISATLPYPDGNGFFFGFTDGVGACGPGFFNTWPVVGETFVKLLFGNAGEVLSLSERGNVYSFTSAGNPHTAFKGSSTLLDSQRFRSAYPIDDHVLFLGPDGALLHDVSARKYQDFSSQSLPPWLQDPGVRLITSGPWIYGFAPDRDRVFVHILGKDTLLRNSVFQGSAIQQPVSGPLKSVRSFGTQGPVLIDSDHRVFHLNIQGPPTALTGSAAPEMNSLDFYDVTVLEHDLLVSTRNGLRKYDTKNRAWSDFKSIPDGHLPVDIETFDGKIFVRTDQRDLLSVDANWTPDTDWSILIGADSRFSITDGGLSDVLMIDQELYLAGNQTVESYSTEFRKITHRWQIPSSQPVKLKGILRGAPLSLSGKIAVLGSTPIDPLAGPVHNLSADDNFIWTVRERGDNKYLKGYRIDALDQPDSARCFFKNSGPGSSVTDMLDARKLPDGTIAVATNTGLFFYNPSVRSWYAGPAGLIPHGGRLYSLEKHLVLSEHSDPGYRLTFIPVKSITTPDSCSLNPVSLKIGEEIQARDVTVDESSGQVAWISGENSVFKWHNDNINEILAAPGEGPPSEDIQRVYGRFDGSIKYLFLTSRKGIWRYDLGKRRWTRIELKFSTDANLIEDINIENDGLRDVVVIHMVSGDIFSGSFEPSEVDVFMEKIYTSPMETFNSSGETLLDVQGGGGDYYWTFVLQDRIKHYSPRQREWSPDLMLPATDRSINYKSVAGRNVLVSDNGRVWWVGQGWSTIPTAFARYQPDSSEKTALDGYGTVWRLKSDGTLLKCDAPGSGEYTDFQAYGAPPFFLQPDQVRLAIEWEDLIFFATINGLRAYEPASGKEVQLPQQAVDFINIGSIRLVNQKLWLHRTGRLLIFEKNEAGQLAATSVDGILELIIDSSDRPWGRFDQGWMLWEHDGFKRKHQAGMTLFALEDANITGVDQHGYPFIWQNGMVADRMRLPTDIPLKSIDFLIRGSDKDWWASSKGRLDHIVQDTCPKYADQTSVEELAEIEADDIGAQSIKKITETTPCYVIHQSFDLPAGFHDSRSTRILNADAEHNGVLTLTGAHGISVILEKSKDGLYQLRPSVNAVPRRHLLVDDHWPRLKNHTLQLPNGQWVYDPVTDLARDINGYLVAKRPSHTFTLAYRGAVELEHPAALDAGWLRWDRAKRRFVVNTEIGEIDYEPAKFIVDKKLLFEEVETALPKGLSSWYSANQHGVWKHSSKDLSLTDPYLTFTPIKNDGPVRAAHGRIMTSNGDYLVSEEKMVPESPLHVIDFGNVTLQERIRQQQFTASISIDRRQVPAYRDRGFIWDHHRRRIAFKDHEIYIQSDAGIQPTQGYVEFDLGPDELAGHGGRIYSDSRSKLYFEVNDSWFQKDSTGWKSILKDPTANRLLVDDSVWKWSLLDGEIDITLSGKAYKFSYGQGSSGFSFNCDQLLDATVHDKQLFVMTAAFLEIADHPDELALKQAQRFPWAPADMLDSLQFADGHSELCCLSGAAVSRWNPSSSGFLPVTMRDNPYRRRPLAETDRLRFTALPGRIAKELRVDHITAGPAWVEFDFQENRFPFDIVTGLATQGDEILIGSAAGLQLYSDNLSTGIGNMAHLYDPSRHAGSFLGKITSLGYPENHPDLLIACSGSNCIERKLGAPFQTSNRIDQLDWRLLARTDLWQWTADRNGTVVGQYRNQLGQFNSSRIDLHGGLFPHDRLKDIAFWDDRAFSLWESGWITISGDMSLELDSGIRNFDFSDEYPERFILIKKDIPISDTTIPQGIYYEARGQRIRHFSGNSWQLLNGRDVTRGIINYADRPPVIDNQQLRLLPPIDHRGYVFEQRAQNGDWLALPWLNGRVAIDQWQELLWDNGKFWAATPAGLTKFDRGHDGKVKLNADSLLVIREPADSNGIPQITDLKAENGRVWVRCEADSAQLHTGQLDGMTDTGVFTPFQGIDPFAERELIKTENTGFWQWRMINHKDGHAGSLKAALQDESIELVGGRFKFDTINSIALYQAGQLDIGTDATGWLQAPVSESLHVRQLDRPEINHVDLYDITRVGITRQGDRHQLCLQTAGGDYFRLSSDDGPKLTGQCPEYLGDENLWRYLQGETEILIVAKDNLGGRPNRKLSSGRFKDDILAGLPVTAQDNQGIFYLWPTQAGVVRLNKKLTKSKIYTPPFEGLPPDTLPAGLYFLDGIHPVYAGQNFLHFLDESQQPVDRIKFYLPEDAVRTTIEDLADGLIRISWTQAGNHHWTLIGRKKKHLSLDNRYIYVGSFDKYIERREAWKDPDPWLNLYFNPGNIDVHWADSKAALTIDLPTGFEIIKQILSKNRLLLFGKKELLELNLEKAMIGAFEVSRNQPEILDEDGDGVPDAKDKCPRTPKDCKVDDTGCSQDNDDDEVCDDRDQCADTPHGIGVDHFGCPLDSDGDGVPNYLDECPNTVRDAIVDQKGCIKSAEPSPSQLELPQPPSSPNKETKQKIVIGAGVHLREAPELTSSIVSTLRFGMVISVIGLASQPQNWCKVFSENGKEGWVHGDFVEEFREDERFQIYLEIARKKFEQTENFGDLVEVYLFLKSVSEQAPPYKLALEIIELQLRVLKKSIDVIPADKRHEYPFVKWIEMHKNKF